MCDVLLCLPLSSCHSLIHRACLRDLLYVFDNVFGVLFQQHSSDFPMMPKKHAEATKPMRKIERPIAEVKKEITATHKSNMSVSDLFTMYKQPKSTICIILKQKEGKC